MLDTRDPSIHSAERLRAMLLQLGQPDLGRRALFDLADGLTAYGRVVEAGDAIARLRQSGLSNQSALAYLDRLDAINAYLAASAVPLMAMVSPEHQATLLAPRSSFWKSPQRSDRLIVVFATAYNNFSVSFCVIHALLQRFGCSLLYIKNPGRGMYAGGSPGFGTSIDTLAQALGRFCGRQGIGDLRICGFSSSGYASLYTAGMLGARAYLGFAVKTDWAPDSPLKAVVGRAAPEDEDRRGNTLVNLRGLGAMTGIGHAELYFGTRDVSDADHARNMAGMVNITPVPVAGATHNVIQHLMGEGRFDAVLERFAGEGAA